MHNLVLSLIFLILSLIGIVIKKTYYYLPPKEIKRRAKQKDVLAKTLYRAVAYGNDLSVLLWIYIAATTATCLALLAKQENFITSLIAGAIILWLYFSFIPSTRITKIGTTLTRLLTPFIAWILYYLHPILNRITTLVEGRYINGAHSRLFEKADLIELVEKQKFQEDNRINDELLEMVKAIVGFDNKNVGGVMTPEHEVKTVLMDNTIGPILIDELHKTKQDYVLVRESPKGQIVGSLAYKKLSIKSTGKVKDLMDQNIYYLHEDDSLSDAFNAFFETSQPVFIAINSRGKTVGVITINSLLKQLLRDIPKDKFDDYSDAGLVAHRHDKPDTTTIEEIEEKSDTSVNSPE